jgi:hypothetical protein
VRDKRRVFASNHASNALPPLIRAPPEILVLVGFALGQRNDVAAGLVRHRAGWFLFPGFGAIEAGRAGRGTDRVGVDECAALEVFQRRLGAGQALAGVIVVDIQRDLPVPRIAAGCRPVCGENLVDIRHGERRRRQASECDENGGGFQHHVSCR